MRLACYGTSMVQLTTEHDQLFSKSQVLTDVWKQLYKFKEDFHHSPQTASSARAPVFTATRHSRTKVLRWRLISCALVVAPESRRQNRTHILPASNTKCDPQQSRVRASRRPSSVSAAARAWKLVPLLPKSASPTQIPARKGLQGIFSINL